MSSKLEPNDQPQTHSGGHGRKRQTTSGRSDRIAGTRHSLMGARSLVSHFRDLEVSIHDARKEVRDKLVALVESHDNELANFQGALTKLKREYISENREMNMNLADRVDALRTPSLKPLASSTSPLCSSSSSSSSFSASLPASSLQAEAFTKGQTVKAKLPSWGQYWYGIVDSVNSDGTLAVKFDDGDYKDGLSAEMCLAVEEELPASSRVSKRAKEGRPPSPPWRLALPPVETSTVQQERQERRLERALFLPPNPVPTLDPLPDLTLKKKKENLTSAEKKAIAVEAIRLQSGPGGMVARTKYVKAKVAELESTHKISESTVTKQWIYKERMGEKQQGVTVGKPRRHDVEMLAGVMGEVEKRAKAGNSMSVAELEAKIRVAAVESALAKGKLPQPIADATHRRVVEAIRALCGVSGKVDWATDARVKRLESLRYALSNVAMYAAVTMLPGSTVSADGTITQRNPCLIYNVDDTQYVSVADGATGKENTYVFPAHMEEEHIRALTHSKGLPFRLSFNAFTDANGTLGPDYVFHRNTALKDSEVSYFIQP